MQIKYGSPVEIESKALTEGADCWHFTAYPAIFNTKDQGNSVILPGAFERTLREDGMPLLLFNHKNDDCPVGLITEAAEHKRGLWIKGELPFGDSFVQGRLVPQLRRRGLKGMSIGYRALESERRKSDNALLIKRVRLYECSFCAMPLHQDAAIESLKSQPLTPYEVGEELAEYCAFFEASTMCSILSACPSVRRPRWRASWPTRRAVILPPMPRKPCFACSISSSAGATSKHIC
jgi:HK97 family phage prohead protease